MRVLHTIPILPASMQVWTWQQSWTMLPHGTLTPLLLWQTRLLPALRMATPTAPTVRAVPPSLIGVLLNLQQVTHIHWLAVLLLVVIVVIQRQFQVYTRTMVTPITLLTVLHSPVGSMLTVPIIISIQIHMQASTVKLSSVLYLMSLKMVSLYLVCGQKLSTV